MTSPPTASEARERALNTAERLFSERGFVAVTLRDIAQALGIKQASLYYHFPGGKEAMFIEVTERGLRRHQNGLETTIADAGPHLADQLRGAADWLLSQAPIDFGRMMTSDMPAIEHESAERLAHFGYDALLGPIENAFERAAARGEIRREDAGLLAGSFLAIIEAIHTLPERYLERPRLAMAGTMINVMLNGLRQR